MTSLCSWVKKWQGVVIHHILIVLKSGGFQEALWIVSFFARTHIENLHIETHHTSLSYLINNKTGNHSDVTVTFTSTQVYRNFVSWCQQYSMIKWNHWVMNIWTQLRKKEKRGRHTIGQKTQRPTEAHKQWHKHTQISAKTVLSTCA